MSLIQFKKNAGTEEVKGILSYIEQYEKKHFFIPFKKETQELLKFRNNYTSPCKKQRLYSEDEYYDNDYYYYNERILYRDMTDEEKIMHDLEEGNGEIHGY